MLFCLVCQCLRLESGENGSEHTLIPASICSLHFSRSQLTSAIPVYIKDISTTSVYRHTRYSRPTISGKPTCCSCLKPSGWPILFFEIPFKLVRLEFLLSFVPVLARLSSPLGASVLLRPPSFELIWRESRRRAVRIRPVVVEGGKSRDSSAGKSITPSRGTPTHKRLRIMMCNNGP